MWQYARPPKPDPRPAHFERTARHIRGRVFRGERLTKGRWLWRYEVTNSHTGKVIICDNTADFATISFECQQAVAVARGAWFWDLTKKCVA